MNPIPLLSVQAVSKEYEGAPLLRAISFDLAAGEILCLLGPSGTGKTTLLRIIAGLEEADSGTVTFEGRDLRDVPPHLRGFGFMFQDLALFPHRDVFENVAFGLRMQNVPPDEIAARVKEMLQVVGLDAARFARRDVNTLSGGEQQRVALARTLAPHPRLVMFDEPLGALDRILRDELVDELHALLKRLRLTALYVTHDQDEAFAIADRIAILNRGQIVQSGTALEIYNRPTDAFVARFLGLTNLIGIEKIQDQSSILRIGTAVGWFELSAKRVEPGAKFLLLRPQAVERIVETGLSGAAGVRGENVLRGRIRETLLRGGHRRIVLDTDGGEFVFEWDQPVTVGAEVLVKLAEREMLLLRG